MRDKKRSGSGQEYCPTWKYFTIMSFLEKYVKDGSTSSNLRPFEDEASITGDEEDSFAGEPEPEPESIVLANFEAQLSSGTFSQSRSNSPEEESAEAVISPPKAPAKRCKRKNVQKETDMFENRCFDALKENLSPEAHFLLSQACFLEKMAPTKQMEVRIKIMQVIHEAIIEEETLQIASILG